MFLYLSMIEKWQTEKSHPPWVKSQEPRIMSFDSSRLCSVMTLPNFGFPWSPKCTRTQVFLTMMIMQTGPRKLQMNPVSLFSQQLWRKTQKAWAFVSSHCPGNCAFCRTLQGEMHLEALLVGWGIPVSNGPRYTMGKYSWDLCLEWSSGWWLVHNFHRTFFLHSALH